MFENSTLLQIRPGLVDESILILRADIVPLLRHQPGLLSLALVPRPDQNTIAILSLWSSQAHARLVEANPLYRLAIQKLDEMILRPSQYCAVAPPEKVNQSPSFSSN